MNDCDFCDDGDCLLCQMAQPVECGASSSHGILVDRNSGNLGDGNHRKKPRGGEQIPAVNGHRTDSARGPEGKLCPICRMRYRDLYHHYNKRHPNEVFKG